MGFISDAFGAGEAGDAADAVAQGFKESEDIFRDYGDRALNYLNPYNEIGNYGRNALASVYRGGEPDYTAFTNSPGYQFQFNEGQKAVENSGSARGMNLSGAQLKGLTRYGQGAASTGFNDWFNRNMSMAGFGQQNANQMADYTMDTGRSIGAARQGIGEARGSGYMAKGNIKSGISNSLLNAGIGALGGALSDERTKENIRRVGETDKGLPIYVYNYIGDPKLFMSVMAQDLEKVDPDAVFEKDGLKYVRYERVQ